MEALSRVLPRVLRELGLENEVLGWKAVEAWPSCVGPRIARHTRCAEFRDGTLRVEVEGSAWMHELKFLERDLIRKINRHLDRDAVRAVRFVVPRGGILR